MKITCTKCKEVKDCSLFHNSKDKKNGFTSQCKSCRNKQRKNNYWLSPEYNREKTAEYRRTLKNTDPEKAFLSNRRTKLKQAYGISLEEYSEMLCKQEDKCAVCGKEHLEEPNKRLVVDHCHTSGKIRGLLCNNCNTALGLVKESVQVVEKLKDYIITHKHKGD
jgi:hypothetical protein